jgi:hypothetical protein
MMADVIARFLKSFDHKEVEREVASELLFHLEALTQEHLRRGMTLQEAECEASKRFGDIERIKNQCVEISRRRRPFMRALKSFLVVVFLAGVLARIFSTDIYGRQVGDMLIVIAALGRLLIYVRGLSLPGFISKEETLSPLRLSEDGHIPIWVKDRRELTPVERVISDE